MSKDEGNQPYMNQKLVEIPNHPFDSCECYTKKESIKTPKRYSDFLTVIGSANTVQDDIKKWGVHGDVACCNDTCFYYPVYNHVVAPLAQMMPIIKEYKKTCRWFEEDFPVQTHTVHHTDVSRPTYEDQLLADFKWRFRPNFKSSGLLAVWIGLALGYKAIITLGITLDARDHFFDLCENYPTHIPHTHGHFKIFDKYLTRHKTDEWLSSFNVRAPNGNFSTWVGEPTTKWMEKYIP